MRLKYVIWLIFILALSVSGLAQTGPQGFVQPYAMAGVAPGGYPAFLRTDSNGVLTTDGGAGGGGGGGGTNPGGNQLDNQINYPLGTFGADSGNWTENPVSHVAYIKNGIALGPVTIGTLSSSALYGTVVNVTDSADGTCQNGGGTSVPVVTCRCDNVSGCSSSASWTALNPKNNSTQYVMSVYCNTGTSWTLCPDPNGNISNTSQAIFYNPNGIQAVAFNAVGTGNGIWGEQDVTTGFTFTITATNGMAGNIAIGGPTTAAAGYFYWDGIAGDPITFQSSTGAPSGPAGGDLGSSYPNPGVVKVNGGSIPVSKTVLASNSSGQIIDATGTNLNANILGNAATATTISGNAPAYTVFGNNTNSSATPGYYKTFATVASTDIATPIQGQTEFNSTFNRWSYSDGTNWQRGIVQSDQDTTSDPLQLPGRAMSGALAQDQNKTQIVLTVADSVFAGPSLAAGALDTDPLVRYAHASSGNAGQGWIGICNETPTCVKNPPPAGTTSVFSVSGWSFDVNATGTPSGPDDSDMYSTTSGSTGTWTVTATNVKTFVVYGYCNAGQGDYTWALDGGGTTTIHTGSSCAGSGHQAVTINATVPGYHSLVITAVGNGVIKLFGISAQRPNPGVRIEKIAMGSEQAYMRNALFVNNLALAQAQVQGLCGSSTGIGCTVILEYSINECTATRALTTFYTDLNTLVSNYQTALPNAQLVFVTPEDTNQCTGLGTYAEVERQVAFANKLPIIDINRTFNSETAILANNCYNEGSPPYVHLNAACGQEFARIVAKFFGWTDKKITVGGGINLYQTALEEMVPNTSTGTGQNLLARENGNGYQTINTSGDLAIPAWPCKEGCGGSVTYPSAGLCHSGQCNVFFYGTASQGNWALSSSHTAGYVEDTGAQTWPVPGSGCEWVAGQIIYGAVATGNQGTLDVTHAGMSCAGSGSSYTGTAPVTVTGTVISLQNSTPANITALSGTDTLIPTTSTSSFTNGDVVVGDSLNGVKDSGTTLVSVATASSPSAAALPKFSGVGAQLVNSHVTDNGTLVNFTENVTVPSGVTLTILSGGTLTCAGGSTCPSGSMVYPAGSGVPVVVSGTSWGTTLAVVGTDTNVATSGASFTNGHIASGDANGGISDSGTALVNVATSSTGSAATIPKFGGAPPALVNSHITDNGTLVNVTEPLTIGTDNSLAGTVQLANGSASAHTIFGSAATTSNTILGPATVAGNGDSLYCAVSSTTCTLTDTGYAYNAIPAADVAAGALASGMTATTQTAGDNSTKVATTAYGNTMYNLIKTSGSPFSLAGVSGYYWNDASGAYTFQLDAPVAGKQYCFGNYSGQTGVVTVKSTTSVYIVYKGANGTVTTGTLVSGGAAGDFVCMEGVDTTHYMVTGAGYGTWTNN